MIKRGTATRLGLRRPRRSLAAGNIIVDPERATRRPLGRLRAAFDSLRLDKANLDRSIARLAESIRDNWPKDSL